MIRRSIVLGLGALVMAACAGSHSSSGRAIGGGSPVTTSESECRNESSSAGEATASNTEAGAAEEYALEDDRSGGAGASSPGVAEDSARDSDHDDVASPPPAAPPVARELAAAPPPDKRRAKDHSGRAADRPHGTKAAPREPPASAPSGSDEGKSVLDKSETSSPGTYHSPAAIAAPAMRAGRHDDNKQYNRFLSFLEENRHLVVYPGEIGERLVLRTLDKEGKSLANCTVNVKSITGKTLSTTITYADGRTQFFPGEAAGAGDKDFAVEARCGDETRNGQLNRSGRREVELRFGFSRKVPKPVPVDIAVVLDTTGSMQSQIDRLTKTLKAIHFQLTQLSLRPDIRFALVAYRDRGDDYVTQVTQFTGDVATFQQVLGKLDADGGGDTPEDLQEALDRAMHDLHWRPQALRLGFIVADAIPHTDYGQKYNYREAMREALGRAVKWTSVGAGGLGRDGEVIFRQIAQFTMGEYVFVTEGGAGNHEGGRGEASHHVGSNYTTENLDQAIVRIVRRELSYLTDAPKDFDDTIVATASDGVPRDTVLKPAVAEVLRQLADYSSLRLAVGTPVAVIPVTVSDAHFKDVGEYLTDQMILTASRDATFRVVERDLGAIAQEIKLQLSDLFDVTETVPIGKMVGADVLIVAKLTVGKEGASLFAKLIRVETGEVLSVAQVEIGATVLKAS